MGISTIGDSTTMNVRFGYVRIVDVQDCTDPLQELDIVDAFDDQKDPRAAVAMQSGGIGSGRRTAKQTCPQTPPEVDRYSHGQVSGVLGAAAQRPSC